MLAIPIPSRAWQTVRIPRQTSILHIVFHRWKPRLFSSDPLIRWESPWLFVSCNLLVFISHSLPTQLFTYKFNWSYLLVLRFRRSSYSRSRSVFFSYFLPVANLHSSDCKITTQTLPDNYREANCPLQLIRKHPYRLNLQPLIPNLNCHSVLTGANPVILGQNIRKSPDSHSYLARALRTLLWLALLSSAAKGHMRFFCAGLQTAERSRTPPLGTNHISKRDDDKISKKGVSSLSQLEDEQPEGAA